MFEMIAETTGQEEEFDIAFPDIEDWDQKERLTFEKECLGFYITGHPLDDYRQVLKSCTSSSVSGVLTATTEYDVVIGGIVSTLQQKITKSGDPMGIIMFEDLTGTIEVLAFRDEYRQYLPLLQSEQPLVIKGRIKLESEKSNKVFITEVHDIDHAHEFANPDVHLQCPANRLNHDELDRLKMILQNNPGKSRVFLHLVIPNTSETVIALGEEYHTSASPLLVSEVESLVGKHSVTLLPA